MRNFIIRKKVVTMVAGVESKGLMIVEGYCISVAGSFFF